MKIENRLYCEPEVKDPIEDDEEETPIEDTNPPEEKDRPQKP